MSTQENGGAAINVHAEEPKNNAGMQQPQAEPTKPTAEQPAAEPKPAEEPKPAQPEAADPDAPTPKEDREEAKEAGALEKAWDATCDHFEKHWPKYAIGVGALVTGFFLGRLTASSGEVVETAPVEG